MRKLFSVALFALVIASTVSALAADDDSLGIWKADVAKCKYTPAPWPVKSLTVTRVAAPDGVKVNNMGTRTDGSAINSSYTAKYDGSPTAVTGEGAPYDSISIKQMGSKKFTYEAKNSKNKYHAVGRTEISFDGKVMTTMSKGTDGDGKPMTLKIVYDKQ
jgi:hypothetical protein